MVYADVVVGKRGSSEQLTYAVPAQIIPYIGVGSLVSVPVRDKLVKAIVVKLHRRVDKDIKNKVREMVSIDRKISRVPNSQLEVANSLARKYLTNTSDVVFRILSSMRSMETSENTGQGKINYLQAVWLDRVSRYQELIGKYSEVLIIFPTNQHLDAFKKSIPDNFSHEVIVMIRGKTLKNTEKLDKILFLGTVGSSFLPIKRGGLIIIDQPNHIGSRYSNRPYLKSEDVAVARAKYEGVDAFISQSIVTPNQLMSIKNKEAGLLSVPPKKTEVVISSRVGSGSIFLPNTINEISDTLKNNKTIGLFVASRGWASGYYCRNCQELARCKNCGRTAGTNPENLVCNYCGHSSPLPKACHNCGKNDFIALGEGLDKVTKQVIEAFRGVKFQVIAGESNNFDSKVQLTITTEKILSFPDAKFDQIIIVSADRALSGGALDDQWKFIIILKELAAMCDKLTIQTYLVDNRVWETLTTSGLKKYFEQELSERKRYNLPPYSKQITIIGTAKDNKTLEKQVDKIVEGLESYKNVEFSVSEYLKDRSSYITVRIQIIFPFNKSYLISKVPELITPNWAVLPS